MRFAELRKASHLQTFRPEAIHLGPDGLLGRDAARANRRGKKTGRQVTN